MYISILIVIILIVIIVKNGYHNGTNFDVSERRKFKKAKDEVQKEIKMNYDDDNLIYVTLDHLRIYSKDVKKRYERIFMANPVYIFLFTDIFVFRSYYTQKDISGVTLSESRILSHRKIFLPLKSIAQVMYYKIHDTEFQIFLIKPEDNVDIVFTFKMNLDKNNIKQLIKMFDQKSLNINQISIEEMKDYEKLANEKLYDDENEVFMFQLLTENNFTDMRSVDILTKETSHKD